MLNDILQDDHARIAISLNNFWDGLKTGRVDTAGFLTAEKELKNHIFWEEEVLFPAVRNGETEGLIKRLEGDHGGIWNLLTAISSLIKDNRLEECYKRTTALINVLLLHDKTEEETIYLTFESLPDKKKRQLILSELDKVSVPESWTCKILRK
ncbi:hemerythrin domain-containing protein [Candidatus Parvarchaeota archaeon]|nr:hemerythrin domain-containing protein [Candidatus Parvarchaeota archaeon]